MFYFFYVSLLFACSPSALLMAWLLRTFLFVDLLAVNVSPSISILDLPIDRAGATDPGTRRTATVLVFMDVSVV